MKRTLQLLGVPSLALLAACAAPRTLTLGGSPETNGMAIVALGKVAWSEERKWRPNEEHFLRVVECELQRIDEEGSGAVPWDEGPASGGRMVPLVQSSADSSVETFVFSDLTPGRYRLRSIHAIHRASETFPRKFRYDFPRGEFPELSWDVPLGAVRTIGVIHVSAKHKDVDEPVTMWRQAEGVGVSFSPLAEEDVHRSLVRWNPQGGWAATLYGLVPEEDKQPARP